MHERSRMLNVDGVRWVVRLHQRPYDRRGTPDLMFESNQAIRWVRNFPANWFELPDDALYAVSLGR